MKKEEGLGLIIGLIIGLVIGAIIVGIPSNTIIKDLGQAICEEEYDMDYVIYTNDVLTCRPMKEHYDGLNVKIER